MELNYKYRLIFTYPATPDKIDLPFVEYAPNQITFNFEKVLSEEDKQKFIDIAQSLDLSLTGKVKYKAQENYQGHWVERISSETLAFLIKAKYNLNTSPNLSNEVGMYIVKNEPSTSAQKEDWRSYIKGMNQRWPGLSFVINDGILKEGKYLIA